AVEHAATGSRTASGDAPLTVTVTVTVGPLPDEDGFFVADDGPGIPERDREVVFETGYTTGGIGLGLAIVENVATAPGWTVAV
ncbi:ATP-binding protein, partial [Halostella sp. PRR32]|uniref:ATP-binding protein n=1 Tax=Halostella sp. PRR32 TaxID=3098147 RepID=UPI002B1D174A